MNEDSFNEEKIKRDTLVEKYQQYLQPQEKYPAGFQAEQQ